MQNKESLPTTTDLSCNKTASYKAIFSGLLFTLISHFPTQAQKTFSWPRTVPSTSKTNTYENFRETFGAVLSQETWLVKVMEDMEGKRVVRIHIEDPLSKVTMMPEIELTSHAVVTPEEFSSRELVGTIEIWYPDSSWVYTAWVDTKVHKLYIAYYGSPKQFIVSTMPWPSDKNQQRQLIYREARKHLADCFPELPVSLYGPTPRPKIRSSESITQWYYRPSYMDGDSCIIGDELFEICALNTSIKATQICTWLSEKYCIPMEQLSFNQDQTFNDIVDRYARQVDSDWISYLTHLRSIVTQADLPDCLKEAYQWQQIVESHLKHTIRHSVTWAQWVTQRMSGYVAKMNKMFSKYAVQSFGCAIDKNNPLHTTTIDMRYYEERYRAIKYGKPYPHSVVNESYSFRLLGKAAGVDNSMRKYIHNYPLQDTTHTDEKEYSRMFLYDIALYHQTQTLYRQYPMLDQDMVVTFLLQTGHVRGEYAIPVFLDWILQQYNRTEIGTSTLFQNKLLHSLGSYDGENFDTKERLQRVSDLYMNSHVDPSWKDQTRTYATRSRIAKDLLDEEPKS